jgi:thiosulfate/3-mercaptopyruvate sulfurtransferase
MYSKLSISEEVASLRVRAFVIVLIALLLVFPAASAASVSVSIDGEAYEFDPAPVMVEERTLVPMRALFEALGAIVEWKPETRVAVGSRDGIVVCIPIDSTTATVNGVEKSLDVPAQIIDNRTFIPMRFVGEAFGDGVQWEGATQTVMIDRSTERKIAPLVSTEWLENNLNLDKLVILDLRSPEDYDKGHIPGAVNKVTDSFFVMTDDLIMELPEESALLETIGSCGITKDSLVVLAGTLGTLIDPPVPAPYGTAQVTRVADTLIYAGVKNVAILDGGYPKWIEENRPVTTEAQEVSAVTYQGSVNKGMFVSTEYVKEKIGEAIIIDARDAEVYSGEIIEPFADKAGHIPTAKSLPAPWIWNDDSTLTYKSVETLKQMASEVIGESKDSEIIIYCGVGGYASSWWYVLTQMLGYENVKFYDGSAQQWVLTNDMELDDTAGLEE